MKLTSCPKRSSLVSFTAASLLLPIFLAASPFMAFADDLPASPPAVRKEEFHNFIVQSTAVAGGAELLTVFGKFTYGGDTTSEEVVPLISVLRDTLGDDIPENDRLRYVWAFSYARPDWATNAAAAVPFFYSKAGNKTTASSPPPPLLDLAGTKGGWHRRLRNILMQFFLDSRDWYIRVTARTFRRNAKDYRKVHLMRALAVLSLLGDEPESDGALTDAESRDVQARLMLAEKGGGGFVSDRFLDVLYQKQTTKMRDYRGHNWELLRQRAESEGLYFEPVEMPDGSATHALLWVAKSDLSAPTKRQFNARFLNIANPWSDKRLRDWKGYSEIRYLNAGNRFVNAASGSDDSSEKTDDGESSSPSPPAAHTLAGDEATGLRAVEMIPLAVYGLDFPKIPVLLVDFRDGFNPKTREASRRAITDITRNFLSVSRFGDLRYLVARAAFDFITSRRGIDLNQPSRMRAYSQLKLLLTVNDSMPHGLKDEISSRLERVSLNPMESDLRAEIKLARAQYAALMDYAQRADGLPAQLNRDRGVELSKLLNGKWKRAFIGVGSLLTWGKYEHREDVTRVRLARLGLERQVAHYKDLLDEAIRAGEPIEVAWEIETVRRALRFITENSVAADSETVRLAEEVFARTADAETRELSLLCFYRINRECAKAALLRIYKDEKVEPRLRAESAAYLRKALDEQQRIAPAVAKEIAGAGL